MSEQVKIIFNEGPDGLSLDGIPKDVLARFKENAKIQFPNAGDDAWANFLSEAILAVAGGLTGSNPVHTYFLTDIPRTNYEALVKVLESAKLKFEDLHARMLMASTVTGALRIISFADPNKSTSEQNLGTFIVTGLTKDTFTRFEASNLSPDGKSYIFEHLMAAMFNAAMNGTVTLTNTDAVPKEMPKEVMSA